MLLSLYEWIKEPIKEKVIHIDTKCCICKEIQTIPFKEFIHTKAHTDTYNEAHSFASEMAHGDTLEEFTEKYTSIVEEQYEKLYKRFFKNHLKESYRFLLKNAYGCIEKDDLVLFMCETHFDDFLNQPPPPSVLALPVHAFLEGYPLRLQHTSS